MNTHNNQACLSKVLKLFMASYIYRGLKYILRYKQNQKTEKKLVKYENLGVND